MRVMLVVVGRVSGDVAKVLGVFGIPDHTADSIDKMLCGQLLA